MFLPPVLIALFVEATTTFSQPTLFFGNDVHEGHFLSTDLAHVALRYVGCVHERTFLPMNLDHDTHRIRKGVHLSREVFLSKMLHRIHA